MIVKIGDIRETGHCVLGIRRWFEARGLDFHDFMLRGIEADRLLDTGDGLAKIVVKTIRERRERDTDG